MLYSNLKVPLTLLKVFKKIYIFNLLYLLSYFPEKNKKQHIRAISGIYVGFKKRFDNSCLTSSKESLFIQFCEGLSFLSKTQFNRDLESVS